MVSVCINWGPPLVVMGVILYFSSRSALPAPISEQTPRGENLRQGIHLLEYAALGLAWFRAVARTAPGRSVWWVLRVTLLGGALFAAVDEGHQAWIPNRDASLADFVTDLIGIWGGILCGIIYWELKTRGRLPSTWL